MYRYLLGDHGGLRSPPPMLLRRPDERSIAKPNLHQRGTKEGSPRPRWEEIQVAALAAGCVSGPTTVNIKELLALKGGGEETVEVIGNARQDSPTAARTKPLGFFAEGIIGRAAADLNGPIRRYTDTTERNDGSSGPVFSNHPSGRFRARVAGVRSGGHNVRIGSEYDR
jgi:hypothetical protein